MSLETLTDKELLQTAKSDGKESSTAFGELYNRYYQKIYNYLYYRVNRDSDIASDIAQDTFTRAYGALENYEDRGFNYSAYLMRIAHNLLVNYYRKPKPVSLEQTMIDPTIDPTTEYNLSSDKEMLKQAIAELSEQERHIMHLRYSEGLSMKDVAEQVGKTENAVKLAVSRIRKKLAKSKYFTS